jgi:hypothetical protein
MNLNNRTLKANEVYLMYYYYYYYVIIIIIIITIMEQNLNAQSVSGNHVR